MHLSQGLILFDDFNSIRSLTRAAIPVGVVRAGCRRARRAWSADENICSTAGVSYM